MNAHGKLILATLATTMLLAIGVSSAAARNLSTNERHFEIIWNEHSLKTKLELIDRTASVNIQCRVTLLGSFTESTITKETLIDQGTINHGELESCTGGTATIQTETMPWAVRYRGFTGTLPTISSVTIGLLGARFRAESGGLTCVAGTEANHPGVFIIGTSAAVIETGFELGGQPEFVTVERAARIPLRGEFLCSIAGEGEIGGLGLLLNLERIRLLRITLI